MGNYKIPKYMNSILTSVELVEGETIEQKVERLVENKEPIKDGAPEIFTDRKEGVLSAYNIRSDRWEIACDAMDKVEGSHRAKRENKGAEMSVVKDEEIEAKKTENTAEKGGDGKPESTQTK